MAHMQNGNVLPYVVAILAVLALAVQFVFNAFTLSNEATRMQNTADAAAYSVATAIAQHKNFIALSNRSLVANQVAMAQVVSVVSWTRMTSTMATTVNDLGQYIPYVSAVTNYIEQVAKSVRAGVEVGAPGVAALIAFYTHAVSIIQKGAVKKIVGIVPDILAEVVEANDPDVDYSFAGASLASLPSLHFSTSHRQHNCRREADKVKGGGRVDHEVVARCRKFRNVAMASRDGFSANRTYRFSFPGMPDKITLYGVAAVSVKGVPIKSTLTIERSGATVMGGDTPDVQNSTPFTTWSAIDATSLHAGTSYINWRGRRKSKSHSERVKLGVGHAYVGNECSRCHHVIHQGSSYWRKNPRGAACTDPDRDRGYGGGRKSRNHGAFRLMDVASLNCYRLSEEFSRGLLGGNTPGVGLTPFIDQQQEGYVESSDHLFIYLRKPRSKLGSYRSVIGGDSRKGLERYEGAQSRAYHSAAASAVKFKRGNDKWMKLESRRRDGRIEYGNAYNPFWEPRLDTLSPAEKVAVNVMMER